MRTVLLSLILDCCRGEPHTTQKMSKYGVFSGPYFPVCGLNTEIYGVNLWIQTKYGKIWTRKNSVFGNFFTQCHSYWLNAKPGVYKGPVKQNYDEVLYLFSQNVLPWCLTGLYARLYDWYSNSIFNFFILYCFFVIKFEFSIFQNARWFKSYILATGMVAEMLQK